MSIPSRLLMSVVGLYKQAADSNSNRFFNLATVLGINLKGSGSGKPKGKSTEKESSVDVVSSIEVTSAMELEAAAKSNIRGSIRDWFIDMIGDHLPEDYFSEENRKRYDYRNKIYNEVYNNLHYGVRNSLEKEFFDLAKEQGYDLKKNSLDILYQDVTIDGEVLKMLAYYKEDPSRIKNVIHKTQLSKGGHVSDAEKALGESELEGQTRPGLVWFSPIVDDKLYDRYVKLIKDNPGRYKGVSKPEELSPKIQRDKADPNIIAILKEAGKFDIDILDMAASSDKSVGVVKYTFRIPLLDSKKYELYNGLTFDRKFPPGNRHLRANKLYEVQVKSTGKKGMLLVVMALHEAELEESLNKTSLHGFIDSKTYRRFMDYLIVGYIKEEVKSKDLNQLIADMGGEVKVRVKSEDELAEEEDADVDGKKKKVKVKKYDSEGREIVERGEEKTIGKVEDLADLSSYGESVRKKDIVPKQTPEVVLEHKKDTEQVLKEKREEVEDIWGPKIADYLFNLTPKDGADMTESIVISSVFPKLVNVIALIESGENIKIGLSSLVVTKEFVRKACEIIFSESTLQGPYAWKVLMKKFILEEAMTAIPNFKYGVRVLLHRNNLKAKGLKGDDLCKAMKDTDFNTDKSTRYSDADLQKFLSEAFNDNYLHKIFDDKDFGFIARIKKAIKSKQDSPAFKKFFDRLRIWDDIFEKRWLWDKLDAVIEGDAPSPIKIKDELKAKMVYEDRAKDPRNEREQELLEKNIAEVEKKLKAQNKNFEDDKVWKDLNAKLQSIKNKDIKTEKINVSTDEGNKFLDRLITYYINARIQMLTLKQASYAGIVKLAYRQFHNN